jgi:hypothetical protein
MRRILISLGVCSILLGIASCGAEPTRPDPAEPGLRILQGAGIADTADAFLSALLEVEVRDDRGGLVSGATVHFSAVRASHDAAPGAPTVVVAASPAAEYRSLVVTTTDAHGRASVRVRLGQAAGPGGVAITVAPLALSDTAHFTVLPGALARVLTSPADSAVLVGNAYVLRSAAADRHGNPRSDPVVHVVGSPNLAVSGGAVRGITLGRGYVLARSGSVADTAWVSVVPPGSLAAYRRHQTPGDTGGIVVLRTDGAEMRPVLRLWFAFTAPSSFGLWPAWSPGGDHIAYTYDGRLWIADLTGAHRDAAGGAPPVSEESPPTWSPDGEWIYFTRGFPGSQHTFWRVRPDGTGLGQVSPDVDWGLEMNPSPDPAGVRLAYQTNRITNDPTEFTLRILDLAAGAVTALDVPGWLPRWSPTGERIAYLDDVRILHVMRPDGSGRTRIAGGLWAEPGFAWSPDGRWLAVDRGGQIDLVQVDTGEVLPLAFTRGLVQASWRP